MLNEFPIFDYEDIQLIPNKCVLQSRAEADTQVTLGKHTFKLPVVPSNMQTILDEDVAEQLAKGGYFYIMHRFDEAGRIPFVKRMHEKGLIASISVGVKDYEYDFVSQLKEDAPEYITIDIAHGHADSVIAMIQHIKKELPDTFVIAGNVGTPEAVRELENAGADAMDMGQSAISHQLRVLRQARLVTFRKEGKTAWYRLNDDHVIVLIRQGLEHVGHQ